MNVYDINTHCTYGQRHCVVAKNMAEAGRIFLAKYWPTTVDNITLHSECVQIQEYDEQARVKS
jgi:hypothetical protein